MNVIVQIPSSGVYTMGPSQRRHLGGTSWVIDKAKPKPKKPNKYNPSLDILIIFNYDVIEIARYQPGHWQAVWLEEETPAKSEILIQGVPGGGK